MMLETCSISLHHSRIAAVSVPMAETLPKAGIISGDHHNNQLLQMGSGSGGKLTLYKVLVCDGADEWFIFRRYNEFRELRDVIRHAFPRERIPFPGKRLFGSNFDPKFVLERRVGLDAFVQKVISIEDAMRMKEVRDFFNMDKPVCESTSSNDEGCSSNGSVNEPSSSESSTDSPSSADRLDLGSSERITSKPSDFEFLKVIGKGSYGKVFLARRSADHAIYAVKVLAKKSIIKRGEAHHVMAERNVLVTNLKHPFLVGLHYSFQTKEKLYFVLDYVNGGELFFHLQRDRVFTEARARFYAAEITTALGYLHSKGVVYRDLKPENLLLDADGHIVLTDFGLCKQGLEQPGETTSTFCGTPEYLAPEVLRKEPYDRAVDWWCLGAVLFEMLCGLPPFYSRDTNEMYEGILHKSLRFRQAVTMNARDLLEGLLEKEQHRRLGAGPADEQDIRAHPFFAPVDWEALVQRRVAPPFRPDLTNAMDLSNIDPEFTKEPIPASVGTSLGISASVRDPDNVFQGFSYAPPTVVDS